MDFKPLNQRSRNQQQNQRSQRPRHFPERYDVRQQQPISFANFIGLVALAVALGYFFMVMLELDMQDARKKRAALPVHMNDGHVAFATPIEVADRKFASMSQLDQHCVQVGTHLMQGFCPRTTGFIAAAMEDFQRISKPEDDDV